MPINVRWLDDTKTIIVLEYVGAWTWDELFKARTTAAERRGSWDAPLPSIQDLTRGQFLPKDIFSNAHRVTATMPENSFIVLVGANALARAVLETLRRLGRGRQQKYHIAATVDDAAALIKAELNL